MARPVTATFKSSKIIDIQTNETNKKGNLDFRVSHLFGNTGKESGGGVHTLYGFDQSNDIRIGFHYGISDKLMVGFSRVKRAETLEGLIKFRLMEQTRNGSNPFALTLFAQSTVATQADVAGFHSEYSQRSAHTFQVIIARKFSKKFSFEIVPSLVHRSEVLRGDKNDLLSIGMGLRKKVTGSLSLITDYFYTPSRPDLIINHYNALGVGIEIETGGHVFSIMFTNASGILENDYIPNTIDSWGKGGYKFSFNISRTFKL
jgi:hypothetical protein